MTWYQSIRFFLEVSGPSYYTNISLLLTVIHFSAQPVLLVSQVDLILEHEHGIANPSFTHSQLFGGPHYKASAAM